MGRKKILNLNQGNAISSVDSVYQHTRYSVFAGLGAIFALGAACIAGIGTGGSAHAASYSAQYVGASVGGNYVRVSTTGDVRIEVIPSSTGSMAVGKSLVNVETNADTGYRLYASGYNAEPDGYTALYYNGSPTNSDKLLSIHSTTPTSFSTPNQWGFATVGDGYSEQSKYETAIGSGSIMDETTISGLKWKGIKSDYQLLTSTSTANTGNPHQVPVYYGVYANNDAILGDYRNIVVYTAFTESSNTISVTPEKIDDGDTMTITTNFQNSDNTSISANNIEITLYDSSNPSMDIGYCDNIIVNPTNNGSNGNPLKFTCTYHKGVNIETGKYYSVQLRIAPLNNGIYISYGNKDNAWKYVVYFADTVADFNAWCKSLPEWQVGDGKNNTYEVWDNRNISEKSYMVRKLADGNCWMVQNLALDGGTTVGNYTLPASSTSGFSDSTNVPGYMYLKGHVNNSYNSSTKSYDSSDNPGAYYSFNAVTAATSNLTSDTASTSICPTGWKLPTKEQFNTLYTDSSKGYGCNTGSAMCSDFQDAFAALAYDIQGNYSYGASGTGGSAWWSASVYDSTDGYAFYYNGDNVLPQYNRNKRAGYSVRCMLEPSKSYMQDVGATQNEAKTWCNGLTKWDSSNSDATTYALYDKRDEKGYLIRRLADGNCWMVQNLALVGGKTIYPGDSDITKTSYKLPDSNNWSDNGMWNGNHQDVTKDTRVTATGTATSNTGAYYSFLVATAGSTSTNSSGDTTQSICPKWWHLPTTGGGNKQYDILASKYTGGSTFNAAFNADFTGFCYAGGCPYQITSNPYARYWSASVKDSTNSYYLSTLNRGTTSSNSGGKGQGNSVRCMLSGN